VSISIPYPGDDFLAWANNLQDSFLNYTVPLAASPENWREWATNFLLNNSSLNNFPIPSDDLYPNIDDWKKWAEFFCNNIYTQ
jgi:hypothetical protein